MDGGAAPPPAAVPHHDWPRAEDVKHTGAVVGRARVRKALAGGSLAEVVGKDEEVAESDLAVAVEVEGLGQVVGRAAEEIDEEEEIVEEHAAIAIEIPG